MLPPRLMLTCRGMDYGDYIDFREISLIFSFTQTAILVVILHICALFLKVIKLFRCHTIDIRKYSFTQRVVDNELKQTNYTSCNFWCCEY